MQYLMLAHPQLLQGGLAMIALSNDERADAGYSGLRQFDNELQY